VFLTALFIHKNQNERNLAAYGPLMKNLQKTSKNGQNCPKNAQKCLEKPKNA